MKLLFTIILIGVNACKGQVINPVDFKNATVIQGGEIKQLLIGNMVVTHGTIEFTPDTSKLCRVWTIPGTQLSEFHDGYYTQKYFDQQGREMFITRFKRGKFLNFYER